MMKLDKTYTSLLVATLVGGFAFTASAQTAPSAPSAPAQQQNAASQLGSIKIGKLNGNVSLVNPDTGEVTAATADSVFTAPTTVVTDGSSTVVLVFSNGSTVEVQPGSRIEISQFTQEPFDPALGSFETLQGDPSPSQVDITVAVGDVAAKVPVLNPSSVFLVRTATSRFRVHDEIVVIGYNSATGETTAANVSGNGELVYENNAGEQTSVAPGQTLQVPGQVAPNGTVTPGEPTTTPNSPETVAKGDSVSQGAGGSGSGAGTTPSTPLPVVPPAEDTTPVTDNDTSLIDPTTTVPGGGF